MNPITQFDLYLSLVTRLRPGWWTTNILVREGLGVKRVQIFPYCYYKGNLQKDKHFVFYNILNLLNRGKTVTTINISVCPFC